MGPKISLRQHKVQTLWAAETELNAAGGDALGHQGVVSLHIFDDRWDDEFARGVDLTTEDDGATGRVQEPLEALDVCVRDDTCHGAFWSLERIDGEELVEPIGDCVRSRVLGQAGNE